MTTVPASVAHARRSHRPYPWREGAWSREPGLRFKVGRLLVSEPAYARLWKTHRDIDLLERTGFFYDGLTPSQRSALGLLAAPAVDGWRTPVTPLPSPDQLHHLPADQPWVVLVTTGGFAPFHGGHAAMLAAAENLAQEKGWPVLGTFVSPSHDGYVAGKDGGRAGAYPAPWRVDHIRHALAQAGSSVPRFVDPWEALVAPRPVNFTAVLRRLERYLSHHLAHPVRAVYVFGADNAAFAEVFDEPEASICVGRQGLPLPERGLSVAMESDESSSRIRRACVPAIPEAPRGTYVLRDEGLWALEPWRHGAVSDERLMDAWEAFAASVEDALRQSFAQGQGPCPEKWLRLPIASQRALVQAWSKEAPVISMDPCTEDLPGVIPWGVSRRFRVADHQRHPHGWGSRPGAASLPANLPSKAILVDDDSSSGHTLAMAHAHLKALGVEVIDTRLLIPACLPPGTEVFDVVDLRDFLPGAREGGLVVEHPSGLLERCPYLAPAVSLHTRARLPQGTFQITTAKLEQAIAKFFGSIGVALPCR